MVEGKRATFAIISSLFCISALSSYTYPLILQSAPISLLLAASQSNTVSVNGHIDSH